ncbi:hypothetical protein PNH38_07400 [Anoxybacillus rupiensis]|uniref:Uncharacterized protein n=1 Tax=Anoxybacteroides rupiense TaxID=311460 RepID=A0ABT5W4G8_9BACL|nr:hypothetical protein [Anoxybacillus rupiensis]
MLVTILSTGLRFYLLNKGETDMKKTIYDCSIAYKKPYYWGDVVPL